MRGDPWSAESDAGAGWGLRQTLLAKCDKRSKADKAYQEHLFRVKPGALATLGTTPMDYTQLPRWTDE